ncbi:hypothetical protein [Frederiksenia canicola]|uniref:D12 class N6 adenine-specific DNA methyltransferase n=1 Tax=Frederiksenia canicola TaxID=123824 RepID=A0AAE7C2C3_9PAST|nr:hypothetical protein [Frederiksenia canicola]QIM65280.1 hypothetical protein A4G17_07420 [Frederiksenia canicola]RPE96289.1 hypothetical protein EDC49_0678 [Frederiksenia canicola]
MARKLFKQAPLPFIGQKRMFLTHFTQLLAEHIDNDGEGWTIVDVFGGSGLLSHTAKQLKPKARVIYNDFDRYAERLAHIPEINLLRQQIAAVLADCPKGKRLNPTQKSQIIDIIEAFDGYKDPHILCSWLLFSGQQIRTFDELYKKDFWHCLRQSDYPLADGYLDGIEVVYQSFDELIPKFQYHENVLLVLDPPYLCTHQASYKQEGYFDLINFLKLIDLTKPPYLFFSSTKSEFVRFIDYLVQNRKENWQTFDGYKRITLNASTSYTGKYEDNLVYKFE